MNDIFDFDSDGGEYEGDSASSDFDGLSFNNDEDMKEIEEAQMEVFGVVDNLNRNMSTIYGLNGKAYKVGMPGVNIRMLSSLIAFMKMVIFTQAMPYKNNSKRNAAVRISSSKMANMMNFLPAFDQLVFAGLGLSPDLQLFFDVYSLHPAKHLLASAEWPPSHPNDISIEIAEALSDLVVEMRREGERIKVKLHISQWVRNADENAERLEEYVDALFARYARLVVVRLELRYRQTACLNEEQAIAWQEKMRASNARMKFDPADDRNDESWSYGDIPRVNILTVAEDWKHFKDNTRGKRSLFRHMVGYVTSIEYGGIGGHHIHTALIFDGAHVRSHRWLGMMIGRYWEQITEQRGYFMNLNRGKYKYPGTGIIDHHDVEMRKNMMRTLMYLAKKDQFVRVKASPKSKTFLTGHMPKPPTGHGGRPRRKGVLSSPIKN